MINGTRYRCESYIGHDSAHYAKDVWWPNNAGLPGSATRSRHSPWIGVLIVGFTALTAIVLWLVLHH